ncbi:MAG: radical SAM protein [Candidatus Thermoplasmatota archaeon]|nr:radical SAM protein [Candidatus Thermoplasmatota archaeon]
MKITEIFHSLQGEGIKIGLPTTFVRTSSCNLRCEWCDTRYAWEGGEEMDISEIMEKIDEIGCSRVCITGGEPLLQDDILSLIDQLLENYEISVETNGSIDISELVERDLMVSMDYKTPSSKMNNKMRKENLNLLRKTDQLKFVISDKKDYNFSLNVIESFDLECKTIFQPVEEGDLDIKELAESVLEDGLDVRVLPQLHKIIWKEEEGSF